MADDFFDVLAGLRRIPGDLRAAATEAACALGIDTFPAVYLNARKTAGKWELVAVALDPALLPPLEPGDFRLEGQTQPPKKPPQTAL